jgi:molecular chaperone DnaK
VNNKLWEGEIGHPVTDNRYVGVIKICGTDLEGGLIAAGADLDCDYEVLDSGTITVTVTVASVGGTFNSGRNFYSPQEGQLDLSAASRQVAEEGANLLARLREVAAKVKDNRLAAAEKQAGTAASLPSGTADPETCKSAREQVLSAKRLLAEVRKQHLKSMRELDLEKLEETLDDLIRQYARPSEINSINALLQSARRVIGRDDGDFENYLDEVRSVGHAILWRQDWFVVDRFRRLSANPHLFTDQAQFCQYVAEGQAAMAADDLDRLRSVVAALSMLRSGWADEDEMTLSANVIRG